MSKQDTPLPAVVPKKRRQVEQALDLHIAMWLASEGLTPSERRRLEEEKARRKTAPEERRVGLLIAAEGLTPEQYDALAEQLTASGATSIHHPGVAGRLHKLCRQVAEVHVHRDDLRDIVYHSQVVVACPKEKVEPAAKTGPVWANVRLAKHRKLAVTVVWPDGSIGGVA